MSSFWPDPYAPGLPLDPERDGWHWLDSSDGPVACEWRASRGWMDGVRYPLDLIYLGPCLTPPEVVALRVAAASSAGGDAMSDTAKHNAELAHAHDVADMTETEIKVYDGAIWHADESDDCVRIFRGSLQIIKAPKHGTPYEEYWPNPDQLTWMLQVLNQADMVHT